MAHPVVTATIPTANPINGKFIGQLTALACGAAGTTLSGSAPLSGAADPSPSDFLALESELAGTRTRTNACCNPAIA